MAAWQAIWPDVFAIQRELAACIYHSSRFVCTQFTAYVIRSCVRQFMARHCNWQGDDDHGSSAETVLKI